MICRQKQPAAHLDADAVIGLDLDSETVGKMGPAQRGPGVGRRARSQVYVSRASAMVVATWGWAR